MPRIFDNIELPLLNALRDTLAISEQADFCVGYFNLRGWKNIDTIIDEWPGGEEACCRVLVGMQRLPHEELRKELSVVNKEEVIDNKTALNIKKKLAEEFRDQLVMGTPTNEDEISLRRLASQIKNKKVIVKLFLRYPLHAKLYLLYRQDVNNPVTGFLGSSNLTLAGLSKQGELNIDVLDHDACKKLVKWFEDRWNDNRCIDISEELVKIIEESWAREDLIPPYHIYLNMAYHLSSEAQAGLSEFRIPRDFGNKLFEFQTAAVKIAAHHVNNNKRNGVIIGDVVGLGKTLMATALARIFEDDFSLETLIICPKNLEKMWNDYKDEYRLRARILPLSKVINELPNLRRFRLVIIDESHNLRNRESKRYRAIHEYIKENESKCILLSATPYNKTYIDLSNQLRLFVEEETDLGLRPENLLRELGETEFSRRHQCSPRSLAAFEKSEYADDWRELMRLYLVRRTRTFIKDNYAKIDDLNGRKYLVFEDGDRSYFPERIPKTLKFSINKDDDQYSRLYADDIVDTINQLELPRYGLGNYIISTPHEPPTQTETTIIQDLSRAGKRLKGFCRTNLFKRLESNGKVFIQSIERHILRNFIFLHAIEHEKPLPLGTQDAGLLDARIYDEDIEDVNITSNIFEDENENDTTGIETISLQTEEDFIKRAAEIYSEYRTALGKRFRWIRPSLFIDTLANDLKNDALSLLSILQKCGEWEPEKDTKLEALTTLLTEKHPNEKIIVFTQFADTVHYIEQELKARGITKISGVTGDSSDPTELAWRFSPVSNEKRHRYSPEDELRVLISTDVLSEGQNLQDCHIVINYDLPWAIIRLVQRAGRVDRIGQKSEKILCYSFLPADGVEKIIRLRSRVRERLTENAEVVGTDEAFFEDDRNNNAIVDLYNENAGILDGEDETEVDLASYAYQIWKNAIDVNPKLKKVIEELPSVVFSTREFKPKEHEDEGVLVYLKTAEGNDALAWIDKDGNSITESQYAILKAAECSLNTPALPRMKKHHVLVAQGVKMIVEEEKLIGGQLGRPSGARFRTYERLKHYAEEIKDTLFDTQELHKAIEDIYRYPLRQSATDTLNRQLRSGISDEKLAELVIALRADDRLSLIHEEELRYEPQIICSMGLCSDKEELTDAG